MIVMLNIIRRLQPSFLVALPLLMTVLSLGLKRAEGPYWAVPKVDPSYAYLMGSLAYAVGQPSMCCLHPGVTVQINGSWVLRLAHLILGQNDLVADVLRDPEVYASILGFEATLLYALALAAAGWLVYRGTGRLELGLLIQVQPLLAPASFQWLSPIAPEAILYAIVVVAAALAVSYSLRVGRAWGLYAVGFGLLSGAGVSTKITYLPGAVMPLLLLNSWGARLVYLLVTAASFAVIAVPHWATVDNTLYFLSALLHNRGLHGGGGPGRPRLSELLGSVGEYVQTDRLFMGLLVLSLASAIWMYWRARGKDSPLRRALWCLTVLLICEALQVGIASRQYNLRYLSPAYALLSANLVLILVLVTATYRRAGSALRLGVLASIAVLAAIQTHHLKGLMVQSRADRTDLLRTESVVMQEHPNSAVIAYYGASTLPFALHFGNTWVYRHFSSELEDLYPNMLFWDAYRRTFEGFRAPVPSENLGNGNAVLLRGTPFGVQPMDFSPPDHISVEKLAETRSEAFYRITSGPYWSELPLLRPNYP